MVRERQRESKREMDREQERDGWMDGERGILLFSDSMDRMFKKSFVWAECAPREREGRTQEACDTNHVTHTHTHTHTQ